MLNKILLIALLLFSTVIKADSQCFTNCDNNNSCVTTCVDENGDDE